MPHRSSTGSFFKWYPQNARVNVYSEEATLGCWPDEWQRNSHIWNWPNKKKRLICAKEHRHWTEEDWKKVLWTDKSKFEVFGSHKKTFVRRRIRSAEHTYAL